MPIPNEVGIGSKVRCIGMNALYGNKLEIGQAYTVSRITPDRNKLYVSENNSAAWYDWEYFETIVEEVAEPTPPAKIQRVKWTKDMVKDAASKFKTRAEFSRYHNTAYSAAIRMGILEEVCSHMPSRYYSEKHKVETELADGKRLFVRYPNRKLYDTAESKYVTLSNVLAMPLGSFKVLDAQSKQDITTFILIQGVTAIFHEKPETFEAIKGILVEKEILKGG
jgi:hypothetical protein